MEVMSLEFSGSGSDKTNWMDSSRLLSFTRPQFWTNDAFSDNDLNFAMDTLDSMYEQNCVFYVAYKQGGISSNITLQHHLWPINGPRVGGKLKTYQTIKQGLALRILAMQ